MAQNQIEIVFNKSKQNYSPHYHNCHEIIFVTEGEAEFCIGDKTFTGRRGSIVIFSRFEKHSVKVIKEPYCRYALRFNNTGSESIPYSERLLQLLVNRGDGFSNLLESGKKEMNFERLFKEMEREYNGDEPYKDELTGVYIAEFLIMLSRLYPNIIKNENSEVRTAVFDIQNLFEREYNASYSLKELADKYHISVYYLSHAFKKITGASVMEYLFFCRLAAAKNMLLTTDLPIGEIVTKCGFSCDSNFSRSFKLATGYTPTKFRNLNKK